VAGVTEPRRDAGVGEHLRALRLAAGLSQADLAGRLQVSEQWVSSMERGTRNPGFTKVLRYCRAIGARVHIGFDPSEERRTA
jgi:transcriptional regulator with XRE-family HTH domain